MSDFLGGLGTFAVLALVGSAALLTLPPKRVHHAVVEMRAELGALGHRAAAAVQPGLSPDQPASVPLNLVPQPQVTAAQLRDSAVEVAPVLPPPAPPPLPVAVVAPAIAAPRPAAAIPVTRVAPPRIPAVAIDRGSDPYDDARAEPRTPARKPYEPSDL